MGGVAKIFKPKPPVAPAYVAPTAASSGIVTERVIAPTNAEVSQATATDTSSTMMSDAATSVANKKKGRSITILQKAKGLGDTNLTTTKKTLGA